METLKMIDTSKTLKDPNAPLGMAGVNSNLNYYLALDKKNHDEFIRLAKEIRLNGDAFTLAKDNGYV